MWRLIDKVIPHHLYDRIYVYLADFFITSETLDELQLLLVVAHCLERAGLAINVEKSECLLRQAKFLSHIVCDSMVRMDPAKV